MFDLRRRSAVVSIAGGTCLLASAVVFSGCGRNAGTSESASSSSSTSAASGSSRPDGSLATGPSTIVGRAPAAKGGLPAIIVLEPSEPRELPAQTAAPVMDQISQTFTPAVLFVRIGQPAEFRNNDDVLHNIRVRNEETKEGAFNVAVPTGGTYTHTFSKAGFYDVGCDIHPGMSAVIVASGTPYAGLAGVDGTFSIADVPPGSYKLTVYADVRTFERMVTVVPGRTDVATIEE
jgi:plastocyanin